MDKKKPTVFSHDVARRVIAATSHHETTPYYPRPRRRKGPVFAPTSMLYDATDGGSGAAAGGGTGTATLVDTGKSVSYTNGFPHSAVPANSYLWLRFNGSTYKTVSWDCPSS